MNRGISERSCPLLPRRMKAVKKVQWLAHGLIWALLILESLSEIAATTWKAPKAKNAFAKKGDPASMAVGFDTIRHIGTSVKGQAICKHSKQKAVSKQAPALPKVKQPSVQKGSSKSKGPAQPTIQKSAPSPVGTKGFRPSTASKAKVKKPVKPVKSKSSPVGLPNTSQTDELPPAAAKPVSVYRSRLLQYTPISSSPVLVVAPSVAVAGPSSDPILPETVIIPEPGPASVAAAPASDNVVVVPPLVGATDAPPMPSLFIPHIQTTDKHLFNLTATDPPKPNNNVTPPVPIAPLDKPLREDNIPKPNNNVTPPVPIAPLDKPLREDNIPKPNNNVTPPVPIAPFDKPLRDDNITKPNNVTFPESHVPVGILDPMAHFGPGLPMVTPDELFDITFTSCPEGFPVEPLSNFPVEPLSNTSISINSNPSTPICEFGFASSNSSSDKYFITYSSYEIIIKANQTASQIQAIVNNLELAMGDLIISALLGCDNNTKLHSVVQSSISTVISTFDLSPEDSISTKNCTHLKGAGNSTQCIVVNTSSTVFYKNVSDYSVKEESIKATIKQLISESCEKNNFTSHGVDKCYVPTIAKPTTNTTTNSTSSTGSRDNSSNQVVQQTQQSRAAFSTAGKIMAIVSASGILVLVALLVLRKRRDVAHSSRFTELEEADLGESTIVGKYGLDVEDKSLFTANSKADHQQFALDETTLDGEGILDDLKLSEDNPVLLKRGGSFNPRYVSTDDGAIDVEEPFFLDSYETYTPKSKAVRVDDSIIM